MRVWNSPGRATTHSKFYIPNFKFYFPVTRTYPYIPSIKWPRTLQITR